MTTEVLRNMIYAASPALDGLAVVVLDEVHYLQDRYRGPVWEEVIVHLDPAVRLVCLSATVSNAEEVAAWIETVRGPTAAVIEERRPVTLEHRYLVGERGHDQLHLLPTFVVATDGRAACPTPRRRASTPAAADRRRAAGPSAARSRGCARRRGSRRRAASTPRACCPAIVFVFSRAGCDQAVQQCLAAGLRLTDAARARPAARDRRGQDRARSPTTTSRCSRYGEWLAGPRGGLRRPPRRAWCRR